MGKSSEKSTDFGQVIQDVELIRTGMHTASDGKAHGITGDDLDRIAASYNPAYHEAPVVIGHPTENGPAWGWVKSLKRFGDRLVATLDLVPEFAEVIRQGLFKKRSASIYPDLDGKGPYLRHVGFLGAIPPAVKALQDINLSDGPDHSITFDFEEKEQTMSWKDKVKSLFTQAVDEIPEGASHSGGPAPAHVVTTFPVSYSESDLQARIKSAADAAAEKARKEERDKATAEFAEASKKAEAETARREHRTKVKARIDALVTSGKVLPAWIKSGLVEFAQALPSGDAVIEFGEAGATAKKTPVDWLIEFLEGLPKSVDLSEIARRDNDTGKGGAAEKLGKLVRAKMDADKNMGYSIAFAEVQRENPDLAQEYAETVRVAAGV